MEKEIFLADTSVGELSSSLRILQDLAFFITFGKSPFSQRGNGRLPLKYPIRKSRKFNEFVENAFKVRKEAYQLAGGVGKTCNGTSKNLKENYPMNTLLEVFH